METKVCKCCGRSLPVEKFGKRANSADGYHNVCKDCVNIAQRRQYKKRTKNSIPTVANASATNEKLSGFTNRELLAEIKARGYRWTDMVIVQKISFDKI